MSKQVGGNHYKDFVIEPIDFITKNNLGYCEGNVIKYVSRYNNKNGKEDLLKAIHYLEMLIEREYAPIPVGDVVGYTMNGEPLFKSDLKNIGEF